LKRSKLRIQNNQHCKKQACSEHLTNQMLARLVARNEKAWWSQAPIAMRSLIVDLSLIGHMLSAHELKLYTYTSTSAHGGLHNITKGEEFTISKHGSPHTLATMLFRFYSLR
jgi:hypothetical protein